jgi:SAM-dependent methyltransferase
MERKDVWVAGDLYEPYVGRWSRLVAREFLSWLSVPTDKDWLDVGCGTGALSQVILETATPHAVMSVDPSAGFIDYAKTRITVPSLRSKLEMPSRYQSIARALMWPSLGWFSISCPSLPAPSRR